MDWYFFAVVMTMVLVILLGNTYFLAHNAHPNDTKFGSSILMRIFVVSLKNKEQLI